MMTDEEYRAEVEELCMRGMEKAYASGKPFDLEKIALQAAKRASPAALKYGTIKTLENAVIAMQKSGGTVSECDLVAAGVPRQSARRLLNEDRPLLLRLKSKMIAGGLLPAKPRCRRSR